MSVRAKFYVQSVLKTASSSEVKLGAVCRGKDNAEWSAATPNGMITMTILNDVAAKFFEPGEEVYLDFTPAPKGQEG